MSLCVFTLHVSMGTERKTLKKKAPICFKEFQISHLTGDGSDVTELMKGSERNLALKWNIVSLSCRQPFYLRNRIDGAEADSFSGGQLAPGSDDDDDVSWVSCLSAFSALSFIDT